MKIRVLLVVLLGTFLFACESKYDTNKPNDKETMNSGKLTAYIDEDIAPLLDSAWTIYNKIYPNVDLKLVKTDARTCMSMILGGKERVALVSREYLKDEDSLMKVYKVQAHQKLKIADDAIVFFVNPTNKLNELNQNDIQNYFLGNESSKNQKLIAGNINSGIVANLSKYFAYKSNKVNHLKNINEVKNVILKDNSKIGIGYLSQLAKDDRFKMIRISYYDSTGTLQPSSSVHQSSIVLKKYPFVFSHYAYLLENRQNLPYWFATFVAKETKVQKLILESGIVPGFAIIKLNMEN
jgi:ABC-type phosphate transport system substrate-binding protein